MVGNRSGNAGMKDPQCVSNIRKFMDNYDWSGLEFPVSMGSLKQGIIFQLTYWL